MIDNNQHKKCVRAISVFVYYGQHVILQHIIDQMMIQKGNTDDLFQTFCNIKQQSGQEMNEDDTWTKEDSSEYGDTTDKTTEIRIKEKIYFNNVDTDIDEQSWTMIRYQIATQISTYTANKGPLNNITFYVSAVEVVMLTPLKYYWNT